jgi:hypothetical protein
MNLLTPPPEKIPGYATAQDQISLKMHNVTLEKSSGMTAEQNHSVNRLQQGMDRNLKMGRCTIKLKLPRTQAHGMQN